MPFFLAGTGCWSPSKLDRIAFENTVDAVILCPNTWDLSNRKARNSKYNMKCSRKLIHITNQTDSQIELPTTSPFRNSRDELHSRASNAGKKIRRIMNLAFYRCYGRMLIQYLLSASETVSRHEDEAVILFFFYKDARCYLWLLLNMYFLKKVSKAAELLVNCAAEAISATFQPACGARPAAPSCLQRPLISHKRGAHLTIRSTCSLTI